MRRALSLLYIGLALPALAAPNERQTGLPANVTVITREDFAARNFTSVADAIESLTFINMERQGSRGGRSYARMRGSSSAGDTIVLIDGRPINRLFDGAVDLAHVPLVIVERIEISRGGSSPAWGAEAAGGAINIVTSRPQQKGLDTLLGSGVARDGEKNSTGRILGRSNLADVTYLGGVEDSGGFMENELFESKSHFINLARSFNGKGYFSLEYFYDESEGGVPFGTTVPFDQWDAHLEDDAVNPLAARRQDWQYGQLELVSPKWKGGAIRARHALYERSEDDLVSRSLYALRATDHRLASSQLSFLSRGLELGLDYQETKWRLFPVPRERFTQAGAYAIGRWSPGPWTFAPAVRWDGHSRAGDAVSPRMVVLFAPTRAWQISLSGSRGFRAPTAEELFVSSAVAANRGLGLETFVSYDAGLTWTPGAGRISINGFTTKTDDVIHAGTGGRWENGGEGTRRGVEAEAAISFGEHTRWASVALSGTATRQSSRVSIPGRPDDLEARLSPRTLAVARLEQRFPLKMRLTHEIRYKSEQWELEGRTGTRIPPYYVYNARFSLIILRAELFVGCENITRRRYADAFGSFTPSGGSPQTVLWPRPERVIFGGFTMRFAN